MVDRGSACGSGWKRIRGFQRLCAARPKDPGRCLVERCQPAFWPRPTKPLTNGLCTRGSFFMAKNIYVGNLAWAVTSDDLLEMFGQYGKVSSAQVITDRETGRSRGFGFVEME